MLKLIQVKCDDTVLEGGLKRRRIRVGSRKTMMSAFGHAHTTPMQCGGISQRRRFDFIVTCSELAGALIVLSKFLTLATEPEIACLLLSLGSCITLASHWRWLYQSECVVGALAPAVNQLLHSPVPPLAISPTRPLCLAVMQKLKSACRRLTPSHQKARRLVLCHAATRSLVLAAFPDGGLQLGSFVGRHNHQQ